MRWLAFGSYDARRHPRVGVIIEGLRAAGDEVAEVNEPLALDTAGRVAMLRQPWRLPILAAKLARCWVLLTLRARRWGRRPEVDAVLVGYLGHFDIRLARLLFGGTPIVLDHLVSALGTTRDRGLAADAGAAARLMGVIDAGALRRADIVVVDTAEHAADLPSDARDRAVVVPVGAGSEWFAVGSKSSEAGHGVAGYGVAGHAVADHPRRLRAVFVGLFTPLHGTATLGAALADLADDDTIEFTIVGTGQDYDECRRLASGNPRVTWIDWIGGADLPGIVAEHDVCLGIYGTTVKAHNVVPTKVFQGAAAGLAIVTSDTPPQREALGDAALFVPPGDAGGLAAALRRLAADPGLVADLKQAARARALQRFTPGMVVRELRERVVQSVSAARRSETRNNA